MKKKISVIIPCHNCSETVKLAWKSLYTQTIGIDALECIFVDDASDDSGKTWMMLEAIEREAPESVMLVHLDVNMRQGGARNVGLQYATGKYLMFLDADDTLREDACELLYELAEREKAEIIQFCHRIQKGTEFQETKTEGGNRKFFICSEEERKPFLLSSVVTYGCWNKFYLLELVRRAEVSFAEHVVYEEPLFVYPLFLYVKTVCLITEALYIYELHDNSTVTSEIGKRILEHAEVQILLLEDLRKRKSLYETYEQEIEAYFLWSFYCETLAIAGSRDDAEIPLNYYRGMQRLCREYFPGRLKNPHLLKASEGVKLVLQTIDAELGSQEVLNELVKKVKKMI